MTKVLRLQHTSIPMRGDGHAEARHFFGELLGMQEIVPPESLDRSKLIWFLPDAGEQEIHLFVDEGMEHNSAAQHICLQVDDLEGYRKRLTDGGYVVEDTIAIVNRPRFFVRDGFGNLIEIAQINGAYI